MGFLVSTVLLSSLAHLALYAWLARSGYFAKHKRGLAAGLVLLAIVPLLARTLRIDALTHLGRIEFMTIVLGSFFYATFSLLIRVTTGGPEPTPKSDAKSEDGGEKLPETRTFSRRETLTRVAGVAAWGTSGSVCGWGYLRGRHDYRVEEVVIRVARLPKSLDGYTIAQVSDLHCGPFVGDRELEEGFSLIRAMRPDLIVATGDLVDIDAEMARLVATRLAAVHSRDGHIAIPGNHDYYAGADRVLGAFRAAGVQTLVNRSVRVRESDRGGIAIAGVDDMWARGRGGAGPDLERALAGIAEEVPRILLAHQPAYFAQSRGRIDVQLSGHTHGGQIHLGFNPAVLVFKYAVGRYEEQGSTLWVNRGFGVAGPPARIGVPPEVTKIVLVAG